MAIAFTAAIPILRIFDEDLARRFYGAYLGLEVDWEHRFEPGLPLYMQMSRAGLVLHLTGHHGDTTPGSTVYVQMEDIAAFHAELRQRDGIGNLRPGLEDAPWGGKLVEVTDPFGNRLRFAGDA